MKKIQFELSEEEARALVNLWSSRFGYSASTVNYTYVRQALDSLMHQLYEKLDKSHVPPHEEGDGC
jgi:hypothetical protein